MFLLAECESGLGNSVIFSSKGVKLEGTWGSWVLVGQVTSSLSGTGVAGQQSWLEVIFSCCLRNWLRF